MVIIKKERIRGIPLLHVVKQQDENAPLPLVIFIHGFESIKERNVQCAYMLAEKGYRVILPEALYHGERAAEKNIQTEFWKIILTTIHELQLLKDELEAKSLILDGRVGLAGTSMGGFVTLGAMLKYDWVKVGVSLMGNPAYVEFANRQINYMKEHDFPLPLTEQQIEQTFCMLKEYDATYHLDKWICRPLLFWHGMRDEVVPYKPAYQFYEDLRSKYAKENTPLSFILNEKAGHAVPNKGVIDMVEWFAVHL